MRIVNIMQCTELGGMEKASLRLMTSLQKRGHQCSVVSLTPLGKLRPYLEAEGIAATGLSYRGRLGWRSFPDLTRTLAAQDADALIMTGSNLLAMLALGRLAIGRRLLAMHFHHAVRPAWQWQVFYRIARGRFNAISYPSDYILSEQGEVAPFVSPICHTVRNPLPAPEVPVQTQREQARQSLDLPNDTLFVGNAGWLIPRKRFDVFLRVAAYVAEALPSVRFVIAGSGVQEAELKELAKTLGISNRVIWLGWLDDAELLYKSIDVLLFNSDWDALPTTPLEAMAFGVPVVASVLNGGLKEVITCAEHGTLLNVHDIAKLGDAIILQLTDNTAHTGAAGRRRALAISDPSSIVSKVETLLSLSA